MAVLGNLKTDFLGALRSAGVGQADVDVVINTHLHFDPSAGIPCETATWGADVSQRPLPNAGSRLPAFHPDNDAQRAEPQTEDERSLREHVRTVFADSISPVQEHIELWSDDYELSESVRLRPAPGHTPDRRWCAGFGKPAVLVGDLTHTRSSCTGRMTRAWDEDFAAQQ